MVYIICGETGEAYNGTLEEWEVGATDNEEEAKEWIRLANHELITSRVHKSSKNTAVAYKRDWKMWFDPKFRNSYNGSHYYYYSVDKLINYFKD